jgi:hypothetical protein
MCTFNATMSSARGSPSADDTVSRRLLFASAAKNKELKEVDTNQSKGDRIEGGKGHGGKAGKRVVGRGHRTRGEAVCRRTYMEDGLCSEMQ